MRALILALALTACTAQPTTNTTEQSEMCIGCGGDGDPIYVSGNASYAQVIDDGASAVDLVACTEAAGGAICQVTATFGGASVTVWCHVRYHTAADGSVVIDGVHCGSS